MMGDTQTCYSLRCGLVTDVEGTKCPKCGGRLRTARFIRTLGWLQLLIGLFLVGLMGTVTFFVAPIMLHAGEADHGSSYTGTPAQAQLILAFFALIILFGFGTMLSGLWQIATGSRNKWIVIVMLGMVLLLVIGYSAVRQSFGG